MNFNKKVGIFIILIAFLTFCSISASFAYINIGQEGIFITSEKDNASNEYANLIANKNVFSIEKNKIPAKYKKYENYTAQVPRNSKIKYKANAAGPIIISGSKVKNAYINFGDGTKIRSTGWVTHTYKKAGWYKVTVYLNATFTNGSYLGMSSNGTVENAVKEYLIYVSSKPQLTISKITSGYTNYNDYKKRNINYLDVKVTNIGFLSAKASKIGIWYQNPTKFGKVYTKLKKFTKTKTVKYLKSGKSTTVRIYFSIPKKYAKLVKNIKLDYSNKVSQISRAANLISFV
ncbi:MAG: PKD domain-containing protein [Methanobacteriaceae archaeon]